MNIRLASVSMVVSALLYSITSYLILLRDAFQLERIGISAGNRIIETQALELANTLKVSLSSIPLLAISLVGLSLSYLWIGKNRHRFTKTHLTSLLVLSYILIFFSFPALSNDVFDYNNVNRVAFIHQANPWQSSADSFPDDPHIYLGSWLDRPSVYPPITFLSNSLVFLFFGGNPLVAMWGFKLINLCLIMVLIVVLQRLVLTKKNASQLYWLVANPLLMIEFIGNAHNDLLLGVFLTLAVIFVILKKQLLSGVFLSLSVLAKVSSIITLPLFITHIWLTEKSKRWVFLMSVLITGVIGVILFLLTSPTIIETLTGQLSLYQKSLPGIVRFIGILMLGSSQEDLANVLQKLMFLPLYVWALVKSMQLTRTKGIVEGVVWLLLVYLLLLAPMVQPWYLAWILPLIVLLPSSRLKTAVLLFSFTSLLHYPVFYTSLFLNPTHFIWQIILYAVMALPPMFVLWSPLRWYTRMGKVFSF